MPPADRPPNESERLIKLYEYDVLDTPPEQGFDDITRLASMICGTPYALVTLVDAERQWFKSTLGLAIRETPRSESFCARVVLDPRTMVVEDAQLDPRFADNPLVTGDPNIRFYAGAPLLTPGGHVLGAVCVIDDRPRHLTDQQVLALEALARQVMARLELRQKLRESETTAAALRTAEKLAVVGRLASAISHEINNPLQSMTNLLYMVQVEQDEVARAGLLLEIQDELKRVSHIVTQSLRFHRQSTRPELVRVGEIVESVLLLFRTRLSHAQASVELVDRQRVPMLVYASDLRQVMANLMGNALDAVRGRGGAVKVRVRDAYSIDGVAGVRITLADTGSGMSPETVARLFEPFFSTKGAQGTGLGLWVSREIVAKHSGRIRVRSSVHAERRGTTFSIFLPGAKLDVAE